MQVIPFPHSFLSDDQLFPSTFPRQRVCRPDGCAEKVVDNDSELRLSIDLPGVKPSDLSITVNDDVLRVSGSRRFLALDGSTVKKLRINRTFPLDSQAISVEKVKANLLDGILTITAPKQVKPAPRTIVISDGTEEDLPIAENENVVFETESARVYADGTDVEYEARSSEQCE